MDKEQIEDLQAMPRIDLDEWLDEKVQSDDDNVSQLAESMKERFQVEQNPEEPVHTQSTLSLIHISEPTRPY